MKAGTDEHISSLEEQQCVMLDVRGIGERSKPLGKRSVLCRSIRCDAVRA